jgi:hypothetical protein
MILLTKVGLRLSGSEGVRPRSLFALEMPLANIVKNISRIVLMDTPSCDMNLEIHMTR